MKLWLDDERPAPEGWEAVKTAREAINVLGTGEVTEVSLDHDLGPQEAGTGYDVACWIEEQAFTNPGFILPVMKVHSMNPVGRQRIQSIIDALRKRFG